MTDHDKTIGRLEAHVDDLRAEVRAMRVDISELKDLVQQARGAKAAIAWVAGLFGGASGLAAAWFAQFLDRG
jgi:hypothetical protein